MYQSQKGTQSLPYYFADSKKVHVLNAMFPINGDVRQMKLEREVSNFGFSRRLPIRIHYIAHPQVLEGAITLLLPETYIC